MYNRYCHDIYIYIDIVLQNCSCCRESDLPNFEKYKVMEIEIEIKSGGSHLFSFTYSHRTRRAFRATHGSQMFQGLVRRLPSPVEVHVVHSKAGEQDLGSVLQLNSGCKSAWLCCIVP